MDVLIKNLANLLRVKTIITLATIVTLCALVIQTPEDPSYQAAFIGGVGAILAYYFNKNESKPDIEK